MSICNPESLPDITSPTAIPNQVPMICIQCDWNESLRSRNGEAWISCKYRSQTSFLGKIQNPGKSSRDGVPEFSVSEGFTVEGFSNNTILVQHVPSGTKCLFIAPSRSFSGIHRKSVTSVGVTPNGLCVSACAGNKLIIWDAKEGISRRNLEGHIGDVYKCQFFPSGVVVLSCGADMHLRIWSAETGQCPVSLRGHTAAVTDFCIVDKGRNIISVSKDGSAKLWSCGESTCLGDLVKVNSAINSCSLGTANNKLQLGDPEKTPSDHEIGTEGKVLVIGCEDGSVIAVAVRSRRKLFSVSLPSAVNSVLVLSEDNFVVGCQDGQVNLFSMQGFSKSKEMWFESNSPVLCLMPYKQSGFFVGKADGTCIYYHITSDNNLRIQLTGSDFDPIYDMSCDGGSVYTACRDAVIRKYDVSKILQKLYE